ncbi:unnamed protein product [Adineta steineri]|uniref:Uncharacterized protein n=2 Tax=Adineta steineri TaxID=433720 RepID=A0A820APY3_9BILA|nr:unnamed protein product [Adineta steineri]CAF4128522.1 unnamed protein product [Adineta steineri]CAF4186621.1 unnamed protein product [Adineta steineri]
MWTTFEPLTPETNQHQCVIPRKIRSKDSLRYMIKPTENVHQTIDPVYKRAANTFSSASNSPARLSHSYFVNKKNAILCDVNDSNLQELLSNKIQNSIDTNHVGSICPPSFSYTDNCFQQSPSTFVRDHGRKLNSVRSVQRFSPYRSPHDRANRQSIPKSALNIPPNQFVIAAQEVCRRLFMSGNMAVDCKSKPENDKIPNF